MTILRELVPSCCEELPILLHRLLRTESAANEYHRRFNASLDVPQRVDDLTFGQLQGFAKRAKFPEPELPFPAADGERRFFGVPRQEQESGKEIISWRKADFTPGGANQRKILQVHIGISSQETKQIHLEETQRIQTRVRAVPEDYLADPLH